MTIRDFRVLMDLDVDVGEVFPWAPSCAAGGWHIHGEGGSIPLPLPALAPRLWNGLPRGLHHRLVDLREMVEPAERS